MRFRMDWRSVKFDWNRARAFLVTAEEGSLSAAARALGLTQPTLGRQVDALEEELDLILFERAGRGLTLTPSGLALLEHVRAMGDAAGRVSLSAAGHSETIEGIVSIAASQAHAAFLLPPIIAKLRARQPGIVIEIVASNQASNLKRREADIAIRSFQPTEPDFIARKVGDIPAQLYATPAYLESIGNPKLPYDLRNADFIGVDTTGVYLKGLNALGFNLTERNFTIICENYLVMWEMVKLGLGIGVMDGLIGDREPLLRRAIPELGLKFPLWLVAHREVNTSRRIRLVYDLLAADLARA
jgi:DNA-binding transcriptional LysR family regulator